MILHTDWKTKLGYLQVSFAALIWGSYGLCVRALDYPPENILFFRFLFGFLGLLFYTLIKDGTAWIKPSMTYWKLMLLPALLAGLSWMAYTYSINYTSVSNAAFLIYTAPVFTVIFAPLVLKERIEIRTLVALVFSLLGTTAIMGFNSLFSSETSLLGDVIALFGGIAYGFMSLFLKRIPTSMLGLPSNIILSGYISLALLPFALFSMRQLTSNGLLLLLVLGLVQQSFAASMFHIGLRSIKAQHAGILTYIEPLAATAMAALFLYEGITFGSILGGALIITSGLIVVARRV